MKIAMIFPGYGSQYVGMGKELYDQHRVVQEYFEEAANCLPINFVKLCFASSDIEISQLNNAYPSLFLVSCAIFALLREQGIHPTLIAGFNQGEYAALFAGKCITFPDGLYLLNKLSSFYQEELNNFTAEIIRIHEVPTLAVQELCTKSTKKEDAPSIAAHLTESDHLVSGTAASIARLRDYLHKEYPDASVDHVPAEAGLHSALMQPVVDNYKIYLEKVDFKDPSFPLVSGIDGRLVMNGAEVKERVISQIASPILWTRVSDVLAAHDLIIEVGPGTMLSELLKQSHPDANVISVNKQADIDKIKSMMPQPEEPVLPVEE